MMNKQPLRSMTLESQTETVREIIEKRNQTRKEKVQKHLERINQLCDEMIISTHYDNKEKNHGIK